MSDDDEPVVKATEDLGTGSKVAEGEGGGADTTMSTSDEKVHPQDDDGDSSSTAVNEVNNVDTKRDPGAHSPKAEPEKTVAPDPAVVEHGGGEKEQSRAGNDDGDDAGEKKKEAGKKKKKKGAHPAKDMAPLSGLFRFGDPCDAFMIFIGVIGAIGSGGVLPAFSLLFGDLINNINDPDPSVAADAVRDIALKYLWVGLGMFAAGYFRVFGFTASAKRQAHRFRMRYFKEMLRQDVGWHDLTPGKEFTSKLSDATQKFEDAISTKLADVISYIAAFIVGLVIGFVTNWKLTLVIISLFPVAGGLGAVFGRIMASAAASGAKAYATAGGIAEEAIGSIRTVTALNAQADTYHLYTSHLDDAQKMSAKSALNGGLVFSSFNLFLYCSYALAFWYGTTLLIDPNEDLQGGDILTVFFCVLFGAVNIGQAGPSISAIQEAQGVAFEAFKVIDRVPDIDIESEEGTKVTSESTVGTVELRDVEFTYPSRPDAKVLKGVSFSVPAGTSLALVGGSGCGKSTCMALIQRFYTPTAGHVLLDGVDINTINVTSLRSLIGIVSQEPTLFATSIMENIKLGAGAQRVPTDDEVIAAAKDANIHDFICSLPDGYSTSVGDQGIQLSGGQKQRVAIARALLRNPKILLLDEATSALDTQSERIVQAALDNLMADRTTIMIAHRLSTVKKATHIIVMDQGTILERGSHEELAAKDNGVYAEMARLQALHDSEGKGIQSLPTEIHEERLVADNNKIDDPADAGTVVAARKESESGAAVLTPEAAKAAKIAEMQKNKRRQGKLMKMAFSNCGEVTQLLVACLMAAVAGSVQPIFSIVFTDILAVFFKCTPITIPYPNVTAPTTYYGCDTELLALLFDNASSASVDLSQLTDPASSCTTNLDDCNAELQADATLFSLYFLAIGASAGLAIFLQTYFFGVIGAMLTKRLRQASFESILKQDIAFFDDEKNSTGALTTRLATDAAIVEAAVGKNIGMYVQNTCTIIVALVIAFVAGWELTLLMLGLLPFMIIGNVIRTKTRIGSMSMKEETEHEALAGQIVSESVRGVRTVASFGIQPNVLKLYDDLVGDSYTTALGNGACAGVAYGYSQFIMFVIFTAAFTFAAFLIDEGIQSAADVMRVFFVLLLSAFSIGQAVALNSEVARGQQAIPRIFDIIERESECDPTSPDGVVIDEPVSSGIKGRIEFKNVHFSYPSRKGYVLKGISFVVEPGQTVALVGSSGSGKSTIFSLIERFYNLDPEVGGEILLDGRRITEYNIATLRKIFGVVEQEPRLFGTTIRENILLGSKASTFGEKDVDDATDADGDVEMPSKNTVVEANINKALEAASAAKFVSQLDDGLETNVGENGKSQMSGGQKQRIAIARALLRDAPIMLLDEATSALDSESEKLVQEALNRIMAERTTLVIAHRLSTIQDADEIIVLDKGVIVERGTHQSLLSQGGKYADLCREQSMATA